MYATVLLIVSHIAASSFAADKCTYMNVGSSTSGDQNYHPIRLYMITYSFANCKYECNIRAKCKGFTYFNEGFLDKCSLYNESICRNTSGTQFEHGIFYTCQASEVWTTWEQWGACSASCEGVRHRVSHCCGDVCSTSKTETKNCSAACPVDGSWSEWAAVDQCSQSCGNQSVQTWIRNCSDPEPRNGGKDCIGVDSELRTCNTSSCPVDGSWSEWAPFGHCSESCGYHSVQMWIRNCTEPEPSYGGQDCPGLHKETRGCFVSSCPVDGSWSEWTTFGPCSHTCGNQSMQTRIRECSDPAPENGGQNCTGMDMDTRDCNVSFCPVDGGWSEWSSYSACSVTCGNGTQGRSRACVNPRPEHGGAFCLGHESEQLICITNTTCEDPVNTIGCHCQCQEDQNNMTIDEKIIAIKKHLSLKKSELSSTKSQKISASDPRLSSARIGYAGAIFMGSVGALLICADCQSLIKFLFTRRC